MARTSCPACGATVDVVQVGADGGAIHVPLEVYADSSSDAPRYRITGLDPLRAERVPDGAVGDFRPDHRADCPGANAGR